MKTLDCKSMENIKKIVLKVAKWLLEKRMFVLITGVRGFTIGCDRIKL